MNHHEWTFQRAAFVYRADQEAETRERMRVAAYHPDAIRVERVDACGGFY